MGIGRGNSELLISYWMRRVSLEARGANGSSSLFDSWSRESPGKLGGSGSMASWSTIFGDWVVLLGFKESANKRHQM